MSFLVFCIICALIIGAWRRRRYQRENDERWSNLTKRVNALEQQVVKVLKFAPRFQEMDEELRQLKETLPPEGAEAAGAPLGPEPAISPTDRAAQPTPPPPAAPSAVEKVPEPPPAQPRP